MTRWCLDTQREGAAHPESRNGACTRGSVPSPESPVGAARRPGPLRSGRARAAAAARGPVASAHWGPAVTLPWPGPSFPAAPRCGRTAVSWGCCLGCWLFGLGALMATGLPGLSYSRPAPLFLLHVCVCALLSVLQSCAVSLKLCLWESLLLMARLSVVPLAFSTRLLLETFPSSRSEPFPSLSLCDFWLWLSICY